MLPHFNNIVIRIFQSIFMVDQGRKLIENGGFYINNVKIMDYKAKVQSNMRKPL